MIALRNPAIRYELGGAEMRDLAHAEGEPLRDEIQTRVDARVRTLASDCAALS